LFLLPIKLAITLFKGRGLWPAIWLMPTEQKYGQWPDPTWPRNGEVDLFEGRGQHPTIMQSNIHFGADPGAGHNMVKSPKFTADCDYTEGYHTWTLDWTPNEMVYKFDGDVMWKHNLNRVIHPFYGTEWQAPFDEYFYVILNVAIGGNFLDGPDEDDVWNYPEAEFWIKSVKITPLEDIVDNSKTECKSDARCENCRPNTDQCTGDKKFMQYYLLEDWEGFTCEPNNDRSNTEICNTLKYLCHDGQAQNELNLGEQSVCGDSQTGWATMGCCYGDNGASCDRNALLADASEVYNMRYDIIDRCDNWGWDGGSNDMVLTGDKTVKCATGGTTTTTATSTTTTSTISTTTSTTTTTTTTKTTEMTSTTTPGKLGL